MSDRERFEEWVQGHVPTTRDPEDPDLYTSGKAQLAWAAWSAARATERKRLVEAFRKRQDAVLNSDEADGDFGTVAIYNLALDWAIQQIEGTP